jgi:hypothetical protein
VIYLLILVAAAAAGRLWREHQRLGRNRYRDVGSYRGALQRIVSGSLPGGRAEEEVAAAGGRSEAC